MEHKHAVGAVVGDLRAWPIELTHNEGTMRKVYDALERAGLTYQQSIDCISDMQNNGLYFREASRGA